MAFNDTGFMPPTWNDGMLESWNNGQKRITSVFGSRLFRSMVCLPACHAVDVKVIPRTSKENNNAQINDKVSRAMTGRSHEPYYFSTKWNTNGPNVPSFHCSIIPIVSEANYVPMKIALFFGHYRAY